MTDPDRFKPVMQQIASGQAAMGFALGTTSLRAAEVLTNIGGNFIVIDMQHGEAEFEDLPWLLKALTYGGLPCIVRAASQDSVLIQRCLDLGADAIVVPYVNTVEEAQAIVRATKYPPQGERSFGPVRAARGTREYVTTANERHPVFVMLETRQAIDCAEQILAVDGIAGGTIGPSDLSLSMGYDPLERPLSDEVEAAIERAAAAAKATGKIIGGFFGPMSPELLEKYVSQGHRLFVLANELYMMKQAGPALLESLGWR